MCLQGEATSCGGCCPPGRSVLQVLQGGSKSYQSIHLFKIRIENIILNLLFPLSYSFFSIMMQFIQSKVSHHLSTEGCNSPFNEVWSTNTV